MIRYRRKGPWKKRTDRRTKEEEREEQWEILWEELRRRRSTGGGRRRSKEEDGRRGDYGEEKGWTTEPSSRRNLSEGWKINEMEKSMKLRNL